MKTDFGATRQINRSFDDNVFQPIIQILWPSNQNYSQNHQQLSDIYFLRNVGFQKWILMSSQNPHQRSISLDFSVTPLMSTRKLFQPFMLVSILWFPSLDYICIRSNSHRKQLYAVNSSGEYVFLIDRDICSGALKKKDMGVCFSAALTWSFHVRISTFLLSGRLWMFPVTCS